MKPRSLPLLVLGLTLPLCLALRTSLAAQSGEETRRVYGFYYDSNTDRYYSTAKSFFTIRPIGNSTYVEKIEVSVDDGEFAPYAGKINFQREGPHKIRFRASDPVLNWSPIQAFSLYVDLTPPKSTPNWIGKTHTRENNLYVSPATKLNISSQDALSGIAHLRWKKKSNKVAQLKNNSHFQREGKYSLTVAAVDNVGNQEEWFNVNFEVDGTPPVSQVSLEGPASKTSTGLFLNSGSRIVLNSTDAGSGVAQIEFQINNGEIQAYSTPIGISANNVTLKFRATDYVGNVEPWKTFKVRQDPIPPIVKVNTKGTSVTLAGVIYAKAGFTFEVDAVDRESGLKEVQTTMNSRDFKATDQRTFTFRNSGKYDFLVRAVDLVGNIKESNPYRIVIDSDSPIAELKSTAQLVERDGVYISGVPNKITFKGYDEGVGYDFTEVSYNGKTFSPLTRAIAVSEWDSQKKTIFYRGVDLLGNREKTKKVTIMVRDDGPKIGLFVETNNLPGVPLSNLKGDSQSVLRSRAPASTPVTKKKRVIRKTKGTR